MRARKITALLLAGAMLALSFIGCTGGGSGSGASGENVDVLRIGVPYKNEVFSAWVQRSAYGMTNYHSFCQLNLWRVDGDGKLTGDGCFFKSWEVSEDNTQLTLNFDPLGELMWHDGKPVTMEDVIFTFNYYKSQNAAKFQRITNVEELSATSIRLSMDEPTAFGFMHETMLTFYLLPKHVWEKVEDARTYTEPDAAIGCGPYKFVSADADAQISYYEAVENYPLGKITVNKVELKSYDNHAAILMALQNNEVDVMHCYSSSLAPSLLPAFENNKDIDKGESLDKATYQILFGFYKYPTNDINFRKAVSFALDYEQLSQAISGDYGEIANTGAISPASLGYDGSYAKNQTDLAKAKEYLDKAGFIDVDGDGMRELPDGSRMEVKIAIHNAPPDPDIIANYKRLAEIIQINLKEVGIRITADEQSMAVNAEYITQLRTSGTYEIFLGTTTYAMATWGAIANYVADIPGSALTAFGSYTDPDYVDAYNRIVCAKNYEEYIEALGDIQRMNSEQTTAVVLDISKTFYPYRNDKVKGWVNYPGVGVINAETWYKTVLK